MHVSQCCTKLDPGNSCSAEDFWEKKEDGNEKWIITERLVSSHIFPQVITWWQCLLLLSLSFFYIGTNMDLLLHRHRMDPMLQTLEEFKDLIPTRERTLNPYFGIFLTHSRSTRCSCVALYTRWYNSVGIESPQLCKSLHYPIAPFSSLQSLFSHFKRAERWLKMVGSQ